jgi:hypothetical protein
MRGEVDVNTRYQRAQRGRKAATKIAARIRVRHVLFTPTALHLSAQGWPRSGLPWGDVARTFIGRERGVAFAGAMAEAEIEFALIRPRSWSFWRQRPALGREELAAQPWAERHNAVGVQTCAMFEVPMLAGTTCYPGNLCFPRRF